MGSYQIGTLEIYRLNKRELPALVWLGSLLESKIIAAVIRSRKRQ